MISSNLVTYTKRVPLWAYLLLLGFITYYTYDVRIVNDMGEYINYGLNIFSGKCYTGVDGSPILSRGPIFSLMIAASYWLLGVSPWSAFWVVRVFAILNPLLIYFLGKKIFGKWIGFSAALLILSSYSMNYWSYRHLDAVWSSFVLFSIITICSAFEKRSYIYFVVSAFFMGLAYLVKEAPVLLFPFPFIIWATVKDYRNIKNLKGLFLFILFVIIIISPWMYYIYSHSHNMKFAMLGMAGESAADSTMSPDLFYFFKNYIIGLWDYYGGGSQSLSSNFSIAPLFFCAWIFTIYRAVLGEKASVLLVILLLLLSPYISYVGRLNLRVGQLIIFLLISYLVVAKFIVDATRFVVTRILNLNTTNELWSQTCIICFLIGSLLFFQIFARKGADKGDLAFLKNSYFAYIWRANDEGRKVTGMFNQSLDEIATWIRKNAREKDSFLFTWPTDLRTVYFLTEGVYKLRNMPFLSFFIRSSKILNVRKRIKNLEEYHVGLKKEEAVLPPMNDILFISSQAGNTDMRNRYLWVLHESALIKNMERNKTKYVVVGKIFNFLSDYFKNSYFFKEVASFNEKDYIIYEVVEKVSSTDHSLYITRRTLRWLNKLKKKNKALFIKAKDELFNDKLGIHNSVIETLSNMNLPDNFVETTLVPKRI